MDDDYRHKVVRFLDAVKPGQVFLLSKIVKQENMEAFIKIVAMYMQNMPFSGGLEFSEGYKKLRKLDVFFDSS